MKLKCFPRKILLGITGSIAAYKSAELIRLLKELNVDVRVVLTEGGGAFITPMTLQTLSGHHVYQTLMDAENEATISHIDLARWADLILIAPATAHVIAKLASGLCDDLLTTLCLATTAPIILAPAMNTMMWSHAATQSNIECLQKRNTYILGPAAGLQACGETGEGRMMEPSAIIANLSQLIKNTQRLQNKKVLITAGPTQEPIDPVRYLSNHSSGKMGYALAEAAANEGASVTLISGPTALACPRGVNQINIISAQDMLDAVMMHIHGQDLFIGAAAVADYKIKTRHFQKLKKHSQDELQLTLVRNPDILAMVAALADRPFVVGFAAETEHLLEHAKSKLTSKRCDMIVANLVGENKGFQSDYNEIIVITHDHSYELAYASKQKLARHLIDIIIDERFK